MSKGEDYSEIDAMRVLGGAFGKLDDDARQRVMDWAVSKYGLRLSSKTDPQATVPVVTPNQGAPLRDIKTFIAQKKPASFYERVTCLAYFLEKTDAKSDVKTEDIRKANTDARLSRMTNPALFVKHATHTYGYLTTLGKRKFAVSTRGEAMVEALPDRVKVEQALANNPFGKKGKKKKAKPAK